MTFDRLRARADRVNQTCRLGDLLQDYGYAVVHDAYREQQFACELHGADNKPSARFYPETNSTYCWVCQKTRDPIAYVMAHESLGFAEAIDALERRLGLSALPWSDDDTRQSPSAADEIEAIARRETTFVDAYRRMAKFMDGLTEERALNAKSLLSYWEVLDYVDYRVAKEGWDEQAGITALEKLRERVLKKLQETS